MLFSVRSNLFRTRDRDILLISPHVITSSLVYRLGYGPFKAEGGVRFPDEEVILLPSPPVKDVRRERPSYLLILLFTHCVCDTYCPSSSCKRMKTDLLNIFWNFRFQSTSGKTLHPSHGIDLDVVKVRY